MKVAVESLTGTLFYVQVGNDASVADLKREIGAHQKIPCDRLILLLDAHRCPLMNYKEEEESALSLIDCGVQDGSHIYLFFNPVPDDSNNNNNTNHFFFTCPDFLLA
ncbi:putative ubiquitin superfamily protein [Senna tora]|uniref:Putative ubiquitin superfamily protein n=1 Tax=Senna tora TaxID=362788 RepID=A0A834SLQ7_9FABA|nr:putative ubiquitin superfamily protein [Senna tora]